MNGAVFCAGFCGALAPTKNVKKSHLCYVPMGKSPRFSTLGAWTVVTIKIGTYHQGGSIFTLWRVNHGQVNHHAFWRNLSRTDGLPSQRCSHQWHELQGLHRQGQRLSRWQ